MKQQQFARPHLPGAQGVELIFLLTTGLFAQTASPGETTFQSVDEMFRWNEAAIQYQEKGRFQNAHDAYRRAIDAAEGLGVASSIRLRLQLNLASLHLENGAYRNTEHLVRAAEVLAREMPSNSPELAGFYNVVVALRMVDGNLSAAQQACDRALAILDHPDGRHGDELAPVLQNLASVQMRQGLYAQARHNLDRSVALLEEVAETHKSLLIRALTNRSTLESLAKNWPAAEKAAARALAMAEAHHGPESPIVGDVLQNYSLILDRLHRGKEARSYRARARALLSNGQSVFKPLIDVSELGPFADRPAVRSK